MKLDDWENKPLHERFYHLLETISAPRFLCMQSVANEMPFFICPFSPEETVEMENVVEDLCIQLKRKDIKVQRINMYDLCINLLKERRSVWIKLTQDEYRIPKDRLFEELQNILDPEHNLVPAMLNLLEGKEYDVLFIDGVGEVYPYLRAHTLLENLKHPFDAKPMVLFFPGIYVQTLHSGASLRLFGRLQDDKYYRAFNIYHYEP